MGQQSFASPDECLGFSDIVLFHDNNFDGGESASVAVIGHDITPIQSPF